MTEEPDTVLRAMTDDGTFRVVTCRTTETVRGVLAAQGVTGAAARSFGDLVTGVILTRLTMSPQLRVQAMLRGSGGTGTLVADSHPTGKTRGLVSLKEGAPALELGEGSLLRMMRTLQDGRLHQGIIEVPKGSISDAIMAYMHVSEQVTTMVAVGTVFGPDGVRSAGGYLVQLLPGARRAPLFVMTERLEEFRTIDDRLTSPDFSPAWLMEELLYAMPYTLLGETDVRAECWCSHLGVVSALTTLPRDELQAMTEEGKVLEISCDYCRKEYRVPPVELQGLLTES